MKNMTLKSLSLVFALALSACALFGCSNGGVQAPSGNSSAAAEGAGQSASAPATSTLSPAGAVGYELTEWDAATAPNGYLVEGTAIVEHEVTPGEYVYTGLDELGRTMEAYACITTDDYNRELGEEREDFKGDADKISGWGYNQKCSVTFPSGKTYNGYFYNRSHLIADSLGGAPARENLVTGTRFQNVGDNSNGGMGYIEEKVRQWLASAPDGASVYYAAKPVYQGDELVPRSVFVDVLTSDGAINEHIEVFNVAGDVSGRYEVDYATGEIIQ